MTMRVDACPGVVMNFDTKTDAAFGICDDLEEMSVRNIRAGSMENRMRFAVLMAPSGFGLVVDQIAHAEAARERVDSMLRMLASAMRACAYYCVATQHVAGLWCGAQALYHRHLGARRRELVCGVSGYEWRDVIAPQTFDVFAASSAEVLHGERARPALMEIERLTLLEYESDPLAEASEEIKGLAARIVKGGAS